MTLSVVAGSHHPEQVLTAAAIRAAFTQVADGLGDAATLTYHPAAGGEETLTLRPTNPRSVAVSFDYGIGPEGAGEIRFDIAGADEPSTSCHTCSN